MGLNESYSHVSSDILLKPVVPTVNQAYATVIQEESQRLLGVIDINRDPLTMLINRRQGFRGKKLLDIACEHCGYKNHLSKDCYRLIGYPADFKSKRKQGLHPSPGGNNNGYRSNNLTQNSAQNSNTQNAGTSFRPYANYAANERQSDFQLTEEEYNHVQNLRINSTLSAARDEGEYKANLAGNVSITSTPASKFSAHTWIIDSGATHHVAFSKDVLADDGSYNQRSSTVQLPTGNKAHITGTGNSIVLGSHRVQDVLHVPDFKFNLLSVAKLTKELQCSVNFFPNFCMLQALSNGKVIGTGKEYHGLYLLKDTFKVVASAALKDDDLTTLWHL